MDHVCRIAELYGLGTLSAVEALKELEILFGEVEG